MNLKHYNSDNLADPTILHIKFLRKLIVDMISEQAAKRHLTQRIENLDGKIDEQIEISKLIRNEVHAIELLISFSVPLATN